MATSTSNTRNVMDTSTTGQQQQQDGNLSMPVSLTDRLQEPDLIGIPDWEAADLLNRPDPSLPERIEVVSPRLIGVGEILTALSPDPGAAFLDALTVAGTQRPALRYVAGMLERGELDAGSPLVRAEIQAMRQTGQITQQQEAALLALGENRRKQSWAEANSTVVNARTVGIARGGKP